MDDKFKPNVTYRLEDTLIGKEYRKVYLCKHCGADLVLGQMQCICGMPVEWEGINAWDKLQAGRKLQARRKRKS